MNHKKTLLYLTFVLFPIVLWGQHNNRTDSICVSAFCQKDSLIVTMTTDSPNTQLSFLMQGIHITICDSVMRLITEIEFPNANMVREKIKHHPNEVKAMHKRDGNEVRPDLIPIISALNDTCCFANDSIGNIISCIHLISLNKAEGSMTFKARLLIHNIFHPKDPVYIDVRTTSTIFNTEFNGRKLSQENRMPPGGMGQALTNVHDTIRNFHFVKKIRIEEL